MDTFWGFIWGLVLAFTINIAKPQEQYIPIQVVSMASGEIIDIKIDPMVFVVEMVGKSTTNVRIYYGRSEKDGFSILIPVGAVVDLRKDYRTGGN